ncbi:MAG: hypothetical protein VW228_03320, partial [Pelagibacteraceae bacterium]
MVKKKKTKKVSKKRSTAKSQDNKILLFVGAALVFVVLAIAFNKGSNKPPMESVNVKDKKVSDIKKTNDTKPLTIPKKVKAITKPTFNEKEVQIRFAEI